MAKSDNPQVASLAAMVLDVARITYIRRENAWWI
jgi:hypothetical protein